MRETPMFINAQFVKSRKSFHSTHGQKIFVRIEFANVVTQVESLQRRMGESTRQVEELFELFLSKSFGG